MIPNIGPVEIGIVLLIVLLVFGPRKLPELGRSVGGGLREFRDSVTGKSNKPDQEPEALETAEAELTS